MSSPVWQFRVGARSAPVDASWGTEADFNGDGFADVVVGAPEASPGGLARAGTVSVFMGSSSGIASTPSMVLEGTTAGGLFGFSVASAGDVNGDGFADLVVGAFGAFAAGRALAGTASVFAGSSTGLASTPISVLNGVASGDLFGASVASAGDVNGDGFADVLVGAYGADPGGRNEAGAVSVFAGGETGISATPMGVLNGAASGDAFGASVASAGDVNADGFTDVVVGALRASPGGRNEAGSVSLFEGSPTGILRTPRLVLHGPAAGDLFGASVASAGDVNGDGYADLVVGASGASPGGRALAGAASVYAGSPTGLTSTPISVFDGVAPRDLFGASVASAGDVNGDGFADVLVGAYGADPGGRNEAGAVSVFAGTATGLTATPSVILQGVAASDNFGFSAASAGDVNGDGFAEIVVGAAEASPGGRTRAGTASLFLGIGTGFRATPTIVLQGAAAGDFFGLSVASVVEVSADAFADSRRRGLCSHARALLAMLS